MQEQQDILMNKGFLFEHNNSNLTKNIELNSSKREINSSSIIEDRRVKIEDISLKVQKVIQNFKNFESGSTFSNISSNS